MSKAVESFSKLPPQSLDLEEAVIAACLVEKDAFPTVESILNKEDFYKPEHGFIWEAFSSLEKEGSPIDILTVPSKLKELGTIDKAGGVVTIITISNKVSSSANIEYHARVVQQKAERRNVIQLGYNIIKDSHDDTKSFDTIKDKIEKQLFDFSASGKQVEKLGMVINERMADYDRILNSDSDILGIPTLIDGLDKMTSGLQEPDLITIAARPGMGKTSLVLNLIKNISIDQGHGVGMFSLEMSSKQLADRLISIESRVSLENVKNPKKRNPVEKQDIYEACTRLHEGEIYIDDTPGINLSHLRSKVRDMVHKKGVKLIIIDYLQLMSSDGYNRENEISTISRGIKGLAKELKVPIIQLSQLSRAVETRGGDKRPQLSDLRDSGAIEQDSDLVMFIYRPEYYSILEDEEGRSLKGLTELIIAKHRNGALGTVDLMFNGATTTFTDFKHQQGW